MLEETLRPSVVSVKTGTLCFHRSCVSPKTISKDPKRLFRTLILPDKGSQVLVAGGAPPLLLESSFALL